MKLWFVFALSAALFWGAYVVTINYGQQAFSVAGKPNPNASMRAFLFIGIAYFFLAIVIPGIWLLTHHFSPEQDPGFTLRGGLLSTLAGALGALGALAVVFAVKSEGGSPIVVAPIVFSIAPIINVLLAYLIKAIQGHVQAPSPLFVVGLILALAGTVLVLKNNPAGHGPPKANAANSPTASANPSSAPHP